ncbi:hypothetical protein E4T56_gene13277 [Termitomyces sp. T112]|nr:hypothetical protein E4T56_gene13277 [Termitomyces sp. T112]
MPSFSILFTLAIIALHTTLVSTRPVDNSGNAYSGKGGHVPGGNVTFAEKDKTLLSAVGLDSILSWNSGNAGHGGEADSGSAFGAGRLLSPKFGRWAGVAGSNSGNAYTQDGGAAEGGSVKGNKDALINIDSNNAGHGGAASSGAAVGGGGDGSKDDHGGEQDHGHEDHHWDDDLDYDRKDHHEDNYEDEDDEHYLDRKRHEDHRNADGCDC